GERDVAVALVAADRMPVAERELAVVAAARERDRPAVLLSAVDPVGRAVVGCEPVELARGLVVPAAPARAVVHGDDGTLVARGDPPLRMRRVDPEIVV